MKGVGKLGEGTYGEAFSGADLCFKIVPMDADMLVNGEPQKVSTRKSRQGGHDLSRSEVHGGEALVGTRF